MRQANAAVTDEVRTDEVPADGAPDAFAISLMTDNATDKVFAGSIPKLYESHLVPLIFQPYADDLARRLASRRRSTARTRGAGN